MAGKKRAGGRRLARLAAHYGLPSGRPKDYEELVGLILCEDVAVRIKAMAIRVAMDFDHGLGLGWAAAMCDIEEEGQDRVYKFNSSMALARARASLMNAREKRHG